MGQNFQIVVMGQFAVGFGNFVFGNVNLVQNGHQAAVIAVEAYRNLVNQLLMKLVVGILNFSGEGDFDAKHAKILHDLLCRFLNDVFPVQEEFDVVVSQVD